MKEMLQVGNQSSSHNSVHLDLEALRRSHTLAMTLLNADHHQQRFLLGYGRCTMCDSCGGFTGGWSTCQNCGHPFDRHLD